IEGLVLNDQGDVKCATGQAQIRTWEPCPRLIASVEFVKDEKESGKALVDVGPRKVQEVVVVPQRGGPIVHFVLAKREARVPQWKVVIKKSAGLKGPTGREGCKEPLQLSLARRDVGKGPRKTIGICRLMTTVKVNGRDWHPKAGVVFGQIIVEADKHGSR